MHMTMFQVPLNTGIISQKRIFPRTKTAQPSRKVLSILDATVARFTPTGALWLFESAPGCDARHPHVFESLQASLETVLSSYPHWAGRLRWAEPSDTSGTKRYAGRLVVEWGLPEDQGVLLHTAYCERNLEEVAPTQAGRQTDKLIWDAPDFPQRELLSPDTLALDGLRCDEGLPLVTVQLTAFACGGYCVAIQVTHPLADAQALAVFMHQWAAHNRSNRGKKDDLDRRASPVFEPELLDRHASPVSTEQPLEHKVKLARSLPLHRFSWWDTDDSGYPPWALRTTQTNMELLPEGSSPLSPAEPAPWSTLNVKAPVRHLVFRFTADMTVKLRTLARSGADARPDISRLDALLAHVWLLINEARAPAIESSGLQDANVHLNLSLGARTRVEPPLPETFVGSPIFLMHVSSPLSLLVSSEDSEKLSKVASRIRSEMGRFNPEAVGAMLHDAAHEEIPQRLWGGFLGGLHVLVTSWTRLNAYELDFWRDSADSDHRPQQRQHAGPGNEDLHDQGDSDEQRQRQEESERTKPRLVRAVMPPMDGVLQIMDTAVEGELDVSLCLESRAMGRLLASENMYGFWGM